MALRLEQHLTEMQGHFLGMQDALAAQLRHLGESNHQHPQAQLVRDTEQLDTIIDAGEQAVEAEGLRLLALQSPVARDLKQVLMMLQSTPDLERAGDYAKHLARHLYARTVPWPGDEQLPALMETLGKMVLTLRAASSPLDAPLASQVIALDAVVDALYEDALRAQILATGQHDPVLADILAAGQFWRSAERLGDHVKNVAIRLTRLQGAHQNPGARPLS
jgi:phosphate transport system protein